MLRTSLLVASAVVLTASAAREAPSPSAPVVDVQRGLRDNCEMLSDNALGRARIGGAPRPPSRGSADGQAG